MSKKELEWKITKLKRKVQIHFIVELTLVIIILINQFNK